MIRMVCSECGSTAVLKDAFARWDYPTQQWVLEETSDVGVNLCTVCTNPCQIIEVTVQ